jgi:predicted DNA-binding protein (UPF0251 family)
MPRPIRLRRVRHHLGFTHFRPVGVRLTAANEVILTIGEAEAIRLKDFEDMDQEKAAKKMNISQPTFARTIKTARKKVADAIINGKAIRIQGGRFEMVQARGRGAGRGFGAGPGGFCVCTKCGEKKVKQRGVPCTSQRCPKCGGMMVRD